MAQSVRGCIVRKSYLVLILSSLCWYVTCYVNNEEVFLNANKLFHEQQFQEALQLYDSLPQHSWAVYYNKACCFFHLDNYVQALVYWQRALKNGGYSYKALIDDYCLRAREKLNVHNACSSWNDSLYCATKKIPLFFWQFLFLMMLYALFFLYLSYPSMSLWRFFSLLIMTLLLLSILIFKHYYAHKQSVIVLEPSALYAGMDSSFSKVIEVPKGSMVSAFSRYKDWAKVYYHGKVGWINLSTIEFI